MDTLEKGKILGGTYEIVEEIGAGGGGIVFKARHLRLQTDVVVKKIRDEVIGRVELRQEADILKKLKHPYLPRVYDFIEAEDGVYTVIDYIKGVNLDDAVKKHGRYSQKQVKKWAEQLGEALEYLHSQNPPIIHSDIKPANIMLTEEGNICLIDFNISLAMGGMMEAAVGISAGFSPPEQYRDPALYARITHNYALQKSLRITAEEAKVRNESNTIEQQRQVSEEQTTEILNQDDEDGATELANSSGEECTTELLNQDRDDDVTELLSKDSEECVTEILAQEDKVRVVSNNVQFQGDLEKFPKYTQFMGRGIDARSDIYSLGITLYYLLTGVEPPVDFEQRIPILDMKANTSEGFAMILEKMMEVSPDERYQNGKEYLKAVRNCHKLDRRYIAMHRKQLGMQMAALTSLVLGIMLVFGGMYKIRIDKNSAYYELIQQAEQAATMSDYASADILLEQAKIMDETRIEAYEEEVYMYYLSGNYEQCILLGEKYINTQPFLQNTKEEIELYGNIYYIVGNAYFEMEDYTNAKMLFEYALEYNTRNGQYYRDYAITLAKMGQIEEAEEKLQLGIELGIAADSVHMAQGEIAHVKGNYEEALQNLNETITITQDMHMKKRAILLCTDVYRAIGNSVVDQEITLLENYVGQFIGSDGLVISEYLADAYTRKAQTDEANANEYYAKALAMFQKVYDGGYVTYQLRQNIAIVYENMDRFEEAEEQLLKMVEDYPERYEVYKRLAFLEADRQQMKENADRDYLQMQTYYEKAKEKYSGKEQDMEMDMLDNMMQELKDGGWF